MVMSWGTELWDQFENIELHTLKGLDLCTKYTNFVKERAIIENEYASKLKKLVKNFHLKKKDKEENECSNWRAFNNMTNEVKDIAGQHEVIAENLNSLITEETNRLHEVKTNRKKNLQESERQRTLLSARETQCERAKRQYEKSFKEAEKSLDAYKKADADDNLSRADVERAKMARNARLQTCEECKRDYALELQKTNEARQNFYRVVQPQIFQQLQDLEIQRIGYVQEFIKKAAEIECNVMPILNACYEGMVKAAAGINAAQDCQLVIEHYKSGFDPPGDLPFEDLDQPTTATGTLDDSAQNHGANNASRSTADWRGTMSGGKTVCGGKTKKRAGFLAIFSNSKK